jgi:hypothetical protein
MNRNGWLAEFSMTLPWLNRSKHDSEVQQAQEESAALQAEYAKATRNHSERDTRRHHSSEAARKIVNLYRDTLKPDLENVSRSATLAYQTSQGEFA